jgi:phosphate-selective porin
VPYGLTARDRAYGFSINRRVNEDLLLGLRYVRSDYADATSGGNRDFTADMLYGRMQLRF